MIVLTWRAVCGAESGSFPRWPAVGSYCSGTSWIYHPVIVLHLLGNDADVLEWLWLSKVLVFELVLSLIAPFLPRTVCGSHSWHETVPIKVKDPSPSIAALSVERFHCPMEFEEMIPHPHCANIEHCALSVYIHIHILQWLIVVLPVLGGGGGTLNETSLQKSFRDETIETVEPSLIESPPSSLCTGRVENSSWRSRLY